MNRKNILLFSLLFGYFSSFSAAFQKIMHYQFSDLFFIIALICTVTFIITAILEIRESTRITIDEKTMRIIGLIFIWGIVGIIYLFSARKRIV
jgi:peptidoglycan/LPS O-acetylase OafA/YrhL